MTLNEKNNASHRDMKFVISCSYYNGTDECTHNANLVVKLNKVQSIEPSLFSSVATSAAQTDFEIKVINLF